MDKVSKQGILKNKLYLQYSTVENNITILNNEEEKNLNHILLCQKLSLEEYFAVGKIEDINECIKNTYNTEMQLFLFFV